MFIGLYLYLLLGIILGWLIDRSEMEKEIPYAQFPSLLSLQIIRLAVYVICSFMWLPFVVFALFDSSEDDY